MRFKFVGLLSILAISTIILIGCGLNKSIDTQTGSNGISNDNKNDNKITIVTSFYPVYVSTINVTKDIAGVEVINMTKPQTGCLHDYQLTPQDLKTLEKADAFVINGAGMEAFLDKVINQYKDLEVVDASKGIELIKNENAEENPHVWVSITNAIIQVENIADQLSILNPEHASEFKSNAEAYVNKLNALKSKMHKALDNLKNKDIITFHEAFPYFAKEFGFNIVAVIEREPGSEPSPKELEETVKTVKGLKTKALFAEPQYPSKAAETIARETGARIYDLDPAVTGHTGQNAYDGYIDIMEKNLVSLEEALK